MSGSDRHRYEIAQWVQLDPFGKLAERAGRDPDPNRLVVYELRTPHGFYRYDTRGSLYNSLHFHYPNGATIFLGEKLTPEEVATLAATGALTFEEAEAIVQNSRLKNAGRL